MSKKRRLTEKEKQEVEARERARNPGAMVRVFVEDETDDNGEPRWHTSRFSITTNDLNSAGYKRHDGRTSDSGCARPSHRLRRGSPGG